MDADGPALVTELELELACDRLASGEPLSLHDADYIAKTCYRLQRAIGGETRGVRRWTAMTAPSQPEP